MAQSARLDPHEHLARPGSLELQILQGEAARLGENDPAVHAA